MAVDRPAEVEVASAADSTAAAEEANSTSQSEEHSQVAERPRVLAASSVAAVHHSLDKRSGLGPEAAPIGKGRRSSSAEAAP